jgi:hypothetical protein
MSADESSNVVELSSARKVAERDVADMPHIFGPAKCVRCGHAWSSVAPVGSKVDELECPACHAEAGVLRHVVRNSSPVWICKCGNDLYQLNINGALCVNCGITHAWPDLAEFIK